MKNREKPQLPLGLGYALAENTSALKYFSELSSEKQRQIIDRTSTMSTRAELRSFVRNMSGLGGDNVAFAVNNQHIKAQFLP